jgi:hypothetical protein
MFVEQRTDNFRFLLKVGHPSLQQVVEVLPMLEYVSNLPDSVERDDLMEELCSLQLDVTMAERDAIWRISKQAKEWNVFAQPTPRAKYLLSGMVGSSDLFKEEARKREVTAFLLNCGSLDDAKNTLVHIYSLEKFIAESNLPVPFSFFPSLWLFCL